jgi:ribonuclease Z
VNTDFKVTFLGTSAASASIWSSTSACLVQLGGTKILIDAGIGAVRQLQRADTNVDTLDVVLLTHWHLDHVADLRGLINARTNAIPLPVLGPELPSFLRRALLMFCPALLRDYRTVHGGQPIRILDVEAEPVDTAHGIPSVGWKLVDAEGGRCIVVSGDTRPVDAIASAASGAHLLVHEATYLHRHLASAVRRRHSTAWEAARLAQQAEVGALILTHTSPRHPVTTVAREAEAAYPGTVVATPLTVVRIESCHCQSDRTGNGWARVTLQPPGVTTQGSPPIHGRSPLHAGV